MFSGLSGVCNWTEKKAQNIIVYGCKSSKYYACIDNIIIIIDNTWNTRKIINALSTSVIGVRPQGKVKREINLCTIFLFT